MGLSLKIPVATLLANAEAKRADIIATHQAAVVRYMRGIDQAKEKLLLKVQNTVLDYEAGEREPTSGQRYSSRKHRYVGTLSLHIEVEVPIKPAPRPNTSSVDRDIRFLKATNADTVTVRVGSDLERYL